MEIGPILTKTTAWLALTAYTASRVCDAWSKGGAAATAARILLTLGAGLFAAHVASAFSVFYGWSHQLALDDTARQARDVTGWSAGWGIYLNYLFLFSWVVMALCCWVAPNFASDFRLAGI